ncbi:uncharacterized protein [Macaca nemestrina]|uniref:uncharacterized protein n=1 Tax=Macaca nemestrina TaxID=9545 RepID=UPI0039B8640C
MRAVPEALRQYSPANSQVKMSWQLVRCGALKHGPQSGKADLIASSKMHKPSILLMTMFGPRTPSRAESTVSCCGSTRPPASSPPCLHTTPDWQPAGRLLRPHVSWRYWAHPPGPEAATWRSGSWGAGDRPAAQSSSSSSCARLQRRRQLQRARPETIPRAGAHGGQEGGGGASCRGSSGQAGGFPCAGADGEAHVLARGWWWPRVRERRLRTGADGGGRVGRAVGATWTQVRGADVEMHLVLVHHIPGNKEFLYKAGCRHFLRRTTATDSPTI